MLIWNVPVSEEWYGGFSCETGNRETVGIIVKRGYTSVYDLSGRQFSEFNLNKGITKSYIYKPRFYIIYTQVYNKIVSQKVIIN